MSLSNPVIDLSILNANIIVGEQPQRVLMVGQMTSAGSATSGALVQNIQNDGSENDLFGENSMLADMVRAFKRINKFSRLDCIPLSDNGSGVAATGSIAFSGTATASGSLFFSIASTNFTFELPVTSGQTASQLATALSALINADTKVPVTASPTTGTVPLTAVNKGTVGNEIGLQVVGTIAGISVALTALTSGANNPSLTGLFSVVDNIRYQTVVYPSNYTLSVLTTSFLIPRFNVNNQILDGVGIITATDSLADLITLGNANNTQTLNILSNQEVSTSTYKGGAIFEMTYNISAYFGAIRSLRLTDGVNISRYVVGGLSADQFGGAALATLPYFNTPIPYLPLIASGNEFTQEEIDELLTAGVSIIGNNVAGTEIVLGEQVTTYKTDSGGNPDLSYKYLNYVDTISGAREYQFNNLKADCRQSRLTDGDLVPNRKMHNPSSIAALMVGYYKTLSGEDYVLVEAGEEALQFYKDNLLVTINKALGAAYITQKVIIVTQLRRIVATIQIAFSTNN